MMEWAAKWRFGIQGFAEGSSLYTRDFPASNHLTGSRTCTEWKVYIIKTAGQEASRGIREQRDLMSIVQEKSFVLLYFKAFNGLYTVQYMYTTDNDRLVDNSTENM